MGTEMWEVFEKSGSGNSSKYSDLHNEIAMLVYPEGELALTRAAVAAMHGTLTVLAVTNGISIGFTPTLDKNRAYKISKPSKGGLYSLSCKAFVDKMKFNRPGYIAIWLGLYRDGVLAFDVSLAPYKLIPHVTRRRKRK